MADNTSPHGLNIPPSTDYLFPLELGSELKPGGVDEAVGLCESDDTLFVEQPFARRVGTPGLLALGLGTCAIIASISFLSFLWTSGPSSSTWHKLVLGNWLARSTVISALVIRTAVAAQTVLCTAMVAGILLQRKGIGLHRVATISMARAYGLPPHWLAWIVLKGHFYVSDTFAVFVVILLVLTSTASQFTSTFLLSGIEVSTVQGSDKISNLSYAGLNFLYADNYWTSNPGPFATFAEYTAPGPNASTGPPYQEDTGMTMRALLPVSAQGERQMLKKYQGYATVVDSRVLCVRPTLQINTSIALKVKEDAYDGGRVWTGLVGPDPRVELAGLRTGDDALRPFRCKSPGGSQLGLSAAICAVNSSSTLASDFRPTQSDGLFQPGDGAFLILQTPGSRDDVGWWDSTYGSSDVWNLYESPFTDTRFSLCYTNFNTQNLPVTATRDQNASEPAMEFDSVYSRFITDSIMQYLGTTPPWGFARVRPVLSLERRNWSLPSDDAANGEGPDEAILSKLITTIRDEYSWGTKNLTVLMCQKCIQNVTTADVVSINQQLATIFSDALNNTGLPSFALQSLLTTLYTAAYYDVMPQLSLSAPASITSIIETFVPTSILPLIGVAIMLLVHFLVMLIVVVFFARVGTFSPLNNVWLAIAQLLHADEISQWASWPDAASMTDKEVVKRMTELGLRGQYYKLTTAEAAGGGHAGWVKRKVA